MERNLEARNEEAMKKGNEQSPFLEDVRKVIRRKQLSYSTEKNYIGWIRRFILWSGKRHPENMGTAEVEAFLSHLASERNVSASTQNQALNALVFLYKQYFKRDIGDLSQVNRSTRPRNIPVVFTKNEVRAVLQELSGTPWLMASLLYGSGLRLSECLRLRIKDIELERKQLVIRQSKGYKDRVATLPGRLRAHLERRIEEVTQLHKNDMRTKLSGVSVPEALGRKYPHLSLSLGWYYLFPAPRYSIDPRTKKSLRHHLYPDTARKHFKAAFQRAGIKKHAISHTFRHSYATHSLEDGVDIRTLQTLLGHKDIRTTMIYTHVIDKGALAAKSPLDRL